MSLFRSALISLAVLVVHARVCLAGTIEKPAAEFTVHSTIGEYPVLAPAKGGLKGSTACFKMVPNDAPDKPCIETRLDLPKPGAWFVWGHGSFRKPVKEKYFVVSLEGREIGSVILPESTDDAGSPLAAF